MADDSTLLSWHPGAPLTPDEVQMLAMMLWRALRAATFGGLRQLPDERADKFDRMIAGGAPVAVNVRELPGNRITVTTWVLEPGEHVGTPMWNAEIFVQAIHPLN